MSKPPTSRSRFNVLTKPKTVWWPRGFRTGSGENFVKKAMEILKFLLPILDLDTDKVIYESLVWRESWDQSEILIACWLMK